MSDYINREAVLAKSKNMYPSIDHYCVSQHVVTCKDIYNLPAADVAPVVHGEWLNFYNDFTVAECDQCASQFEVTFDGEANGALWNGFKQSYKYCPNCGARMDGGKHD